MKYVVITGASTGIGYDAARYLISRGVHVFGSVRKQADADRVRAELGEQFTPLLFDVTYGAAIETAVTQVSTKIGRSGLAGLGNNASIAVAGPLMYLPLAEFRRQMEINLYGQLEVTQKFLPLLGAVPKAPHPPGRIVNITALARRRAEAAAGFLEQAGVSRDKLRLSWQGAGDPVAGLRPSERGQSRRVEIEFYTAAPMIVSLRSAAANGKGTTAASL